MQRLAQRRQQPPRASPCLLRARCRPNYNRQLRFFKFVIHLCRARPALSSLRKTHARRKILQRRIFRSRIFTVYFLPRCISSSRELPRVAYFFLGVNCLVSRVSHSPSRFFSFSLSLGFKCSLCRAFSRRKFSLVMHFSIFYLSLGTFFPEHLFFIADFLVTRSFISRVFSPALFFTPFFIIRSSITAFLAVRFPVANFSYFFVVYFLFPEAISLISSSQIRL